MKLYRNLNILTYLAAVAVATCISSCQDEVFYTQDDYEINSDMILFDAYVGRCEATTRSGETPSDIEPLELGEGENQLYLHTYVCDNSYDPTEFQPETNTRGLQVNDMPGLEILHGTFAVEANFPEKTGFPHYFTSKNGEKVSNDVWRATGPAIYWPGNDAKLHFHAWAPAALPEEVRNISKSQEKVTFDYTAQKSSDGNKDAEAQTDFLWAINKGCSKSTSTSGRAPLRFTHPLSAIKFSVRDVIGGRIRRITLKNVYSKGSCTYTASASGEGSYAWTNHAEKSDFSQVFDVEVTPAADLSDVSITDKKPEATFMMIPQVISEDAVIEVVIEQYGIKNPDGTAAPNRTLTLSGKMKVDDAANNPNHVSAWEAGKEYVYTISTTKDNWIYVFDAEGNEAEGYENIYVYSPDDDEFQDLGNNAYFNVKSYRYKANDHMVIEALPWSASHDGSLSYIVDGVAETAYPLANPQLKWVTSDKWITDCSSGPLLPLKGSGKGSHTNPWEKHDLSFLPHFITTDWIGDEVMQGYEQYPGFNKSNPYDLSTYGGLRSRTTANCYIIDRGGWYMFPLAYGNSVKNDIPNISAYQCQNTSTSTDLKLLKTLTDYRDIAITSPYISVNNNAKAELVWQDAYGMVDNVELITIGSEKMIRFHIESNDLQQGNAIIALTEGNNSTEGKSTVIWSWHIWATEHWIDKDTRLPHVYDQNNSTFNTYTSSAAKTDYNVVIGLRQCGDVEVTYNQHGRTFMMSAYNLGWCDPKKVMYLKRKGEMDFIQYMPDGKALTGKTDRLPIIQEGITIDYKYANNTYYQWGRKDPIRGYFNHEHETKRVFGPRQPYIIQDKPVNIGEGIQNPEVFYCSAANGASAFEDWLTTNFKSNLWNNASNTSLELRDDADDHEDLWSHTKTVYDPSPAGYMVPNAGVWHVVQKNHSTQWTDDNGNVYTTTYLSNGKRYGDSNHTIPLSQRDTWAGGNWTLQKFKDKINGARIDDFNYKIWGRGAANDNSNALFFSSTGNRWWTSGVKPGGYLGGAGGNFGRNVSYAWSSRSYSGKNAYGMALGLDTDREINGDNAEIRYYVGGQFIGRRTMGRPVRAIREP